LPWHVSGRRTVSSGYAGACFAADRKESALRRSVRTLGAVLDANRSWRVQILQAAVAASYGQRSRATLLCSLFDGLRGGSLPLYSRVIDIGNAPNTELGGYDADARNQVRQARRNGLVVEVVTPGTRAEALGVLRTYQQLHVTSWQRTGLRPHQLDYWLGLHDAVVEGGGTNVVVLVHDPNGVPVAGATCHLYNGRALYWSGCSTDDGLRLRANPLCLHAAVEACRHEGASWFELGRFNVVERDPKERSVTQYKSQFGGELLQLANVSPRRSVIGRSRAVLGRARRRVRR